jgi:hypothetical protein
MVYSCVVINAAFGLENSRKRYCFMGVEGLVQAAIAVMCCLRRMVCGHYNDTMQVKK